MLLGRVALPSLAILSSLQVCWLLLTPLKACVPQTTRGSLRLILHLQRNLEVITILPLPWPPRASVNVARRRNES